MFDAADVKRPPGRPSRYSDETAAEICDRLAAGESLNAICRDEHMPHERTIRRWAIEDHEGFSPRYACARELQAEHLFDEIVDIADRVANEREAAIVNAARLAIDARKWVASKMLPKKYGDRLDVQQDGQLVVRIIHGLGERRGEPAVGAELPRLR